MRRSVTSVRRDAAAPAGPAGPRTLWEALRVFLQHGSPRILVAALVAAVAVRVSLGGFSAADLVPMAALLVVWPVQEWLIHVFILHFRPLRIAGRVLDFPVPRAHREHHRNPWDLPLVFIPMHSFFYSVPFVVLLWLALTPRPALAATGIVFHLTLTLHYEWVHFLIHTRVVPRSRIYQRLWKNHRRHHFKNEAFWFGVTMLGGDRLLRTDPAPADVPTSPTCRDLLAALAPQDRATVIPAGPGS
jgi:hypothetical protein